MESGELVLAPHGKGAALAESEASAPGAKAAAPQTRSTVAAAKLGSITGANERGLKPAARTTASAIAAQVMINSRLPQPVLDLP